mgnify:FL=1
MRKSTPFALAICALSIGFSVAAYSQTPQFPTSPSPSQAAQPAAQAASTWVNPQLGREPVAYKLPARAGEKPAPGDFWRTQGFFGLWTLTCDIVLSKNVKVCRIGQDAELPSRLGSLHVDVAVGVDEKAYAFIFAPPWADRDAGVSIAVNGARLPVPFDYCNVEHCRASAAFSGMLQAAMLGNGSVLGAVKKNGVEVGTAIITEQLNAAARMSASPKVLTGVPSDPSSAAKDGAGKGGAGKPAGKK